MKTTRMKATKRTTATATTTTTTRTTTYNSMNKAGEVFKAGEIVAKNERVVIEVNKRKSAMDAAVKVAAYKKKEDNLSCLSVKHVSITRHGWKRVYKSMVTSIQFCA